MTYTTPATVATGGTSTSAQFNAALRDNAAALASHAEIAFITSDTNPTLISYTFPASSTTKITGGTLADDSPDGMVDLVNQRIVIRQAGMYRVFMSGPVPPFVRKNGAGTLLAQTNNPGTMEYAFVLAVNDYLELWFQNTSGSLATVVGFAPDAPDGTVFRMRAEWVAP